MRYKYVVTVLRVLVHFTHSHFQSIQFSTVYSHWIFRCTVSCYYQYEYYVYMLRYVSHWN